MVDLVRLRRIITFVQYMNYQCFLYGQRQKQIKLFEERLKVQRQIKALFTKVSGASLLLSAYFSNPLIGAVGCSVLSVLERTTLLEITTRSVFQWWNELDVTVRRRVTFAASAVTAVSVILLFSYIMPKPNSRGGIDILPKTTRLVGKGLDAEVAADFCKVIYDYSQRNPFSSNFRIPQSEMSF